MRIKDIYLSIFDSHLDRWDPNSPGKVRDFLMPYRLIERWYDMRVVNMEHGKLEASIFKLSRELGDSGADVFARIDEDEVFRSDVVSYMRRALDKPRSVTLQAAKKIMGEDKVIGPDQIQNFFGIVLSPKTLEIAERIPYLPKTLARYSRTHLLVFGCLANIHEIMDKSKVGFGWQLPEIAGGDEPAMLTSLPTQGWFLINRFAINYVAKGQRLATVADIYYALSLHKETNKRKYFFYDRAVCQETPEGGEVYFGKGRTEYTCRSYCVQKEVGENISGKITVVLPDDPIN